MSRKNWKKVQLFGISEQFGTDRFLIINGTDVYHIGASLKDLGKKMFAFSKLEIPAASITALL